MSRSMLSRLGIALGIAFLTGCGGAPNPLGSPLGMPTADIYATKFADQGRLPTAIPGTPGTPLADKLTIGPPEITPDATAFAPMMYHATPAGAGYIVPVSAPFSGLSYHFENEWYEDTDNATRRTEVWVGSVSAPGGGDTQKGVVVVSVVVLTTQDNQAILKQVHLGEYLTPCQGGSVHIVGATGEVLTLQAASGHTFYFDVPARQFVPPPNASPTPTPNPATDWVFSGSVDTGTSDPPPCADLTLYQQAGTTWQLLAQASPSAEGTFSLRVPGPRPPGRFLLVVQYPPGFMPGWPVAGAGMGVVDRHSLMSLGALAPGEYGGQRFVGLYVPHATPLPGTRTPPPLPTPPLGTWTPPPTLVSPLATPTP